MALSFSKRSPWKSIYISIYAIFRRVKLQISQKNWRHHCRDMPLHLRQWQYHLPLYLYVARRYIIYHKLSRRLLSIPLLIQVFKHSVLPNCKYIKYINILEERTYNLAENADSRLLSDTLKPRFTPPIQCIKGRGATLVDIRSSP